MIKKDKNLIIGLTLILIVLGIGIYINFFNDGLGEPTHKSYDNYEILKPIDEGGNVDVNNETLEQLGVNDFLESSQEVISCGGFCKEFEFTLINPIDLTIDYNNHIEVSLLKTNNEEVTFKYYTYEFVNNSRTERRTDVRDSKNNYLNGSIRYESFNYDEYIFDEGWEWVIIINPFTNLNYREEKKIKVKAYFSPRIGLQNVDWKITANINDFEYDPKWVWFNTSYSYCRTVTVSGLNNTNSLVKAWVNDTDIDTNNYKDIVVSNAGCDGGGSAISFETYNTTVTDKVQLAWLSNNQEYGVYYGNSDADGTQNTTIIFSEDKFDNNLGCGNWKLFGSGTITCNSNYIELFHSGGAYPTGYKNITNSTYNKETNISEVTEGFTLINDRKYGGAGDFIWSGFRWGSANHKYYWANNPSLQTPYNTIDPPDTVDILKWQTQVNYLNTSTAVILVYNLSTGVLLATTSGTGAFTGSEVYPFVGWQTEGNTGEETYTAFYDNIYMLRGLANYSVGYTYTVGSEETQVEISNNPIFNVTINSTNIKHNNTLVNLSVTFKNLDSNGLTNISVWYENNVSMLALYMPFDTNASSGEETKGYSGFLNNGTIYGAKYTNDGKVGGGFEFDGNTNNYIQFNNKGLNTTKWTVSFWMNPYTINGLEDVGLFSTSSGQSRFNIIMSDSLGYVSIQYRNFTSTTKSKSFSGYQFILNEFQHMVFMYNETNFVSYVNGEFNQSFDSSAQGIIQFSNMDTLIRIGNDQWNPGTGNFNGTLDELKVWNRTLSPEQIYQEYLAGASGLPSSILVSEETTLGNTYKVAGYVPNRTSFGMNINTTELLIRNAPPTTPNINYPDDGILTPNYSISLNCSGSTDIEGDSINYEFYADGTNPPTTLRSNYSATNSTYNLNEGINYWRCRANDGIGVSDYNDTRTITVDRRLITSNITTFNHSILEGTTQEFILNITKNNLTVSNINSEFIYDNISYAVTKLQESYDRFSFTSSFIIPSVPSDGTVNLLNWNLTIIQLNSTIVYNTSFSGGQNVEKLFLDNCTTYGTVIFNFTLVDEETQVKLSNGTIETAFNIYTSDRTSLIANLSASYTNIDPLSICMNENLTSTNEYSLDTIVRYEGQDSANEYYNIVDFELTDDTLTQNIVLYDLNISDSTEFQLTFLGGDFLPVANALVSVDRQYISENLFKTVELPKTDTNGQTLLHLVRNDVIYNLRIIKDGIVLGNFENLIAFCDDFIIGDCRIDLTASSSIIETFNFETDLGITFNTPTFDEDTRDISFDFVSSNGEVKEVTMEIINNDIFGNRTVCIENLLSSGGTLTCNVPSSIEDSFLLMSIFVGDDLVVYHNVRIDSENYGSAGYVIYFFMLISFVLMFIKSKTAVLFGMIVAMVTGVSLGLTSDSIVGLGASGLWVILVCGFGIWMLNKERKG